MKEGHARAGGHSMLTGGRLVLAAGCLALAATGCAALTGAGPGGGGGATAADTSGGDGETADTARVAATPGDSAVLAPGRRAPSDSAYLALLDSARALARGGGEPAATPEPDTAGGDPEEAGETEETGDGYPAGPVTVTDVEKLMELGPVYTPYHLGPTLATREDRLDGLLKATLVPVIQRYELAPDEWARYWVLVDAEGRVRDATLQLPSGHASFDSAARAVAENLRYSPARRNDEPVPVWILARISLLMR